jgi:hypothetical protein
VLIALRILFMNVGVPMENTSHYIWSSNIDEQIAHYSACLKKSLPFIAISKETGDYVIITYFSVFMYELNITKDDLKDMNSFDMAYQKSVEKMPQCLPSIEFFYQNYCKMFSVPEDKCLVCGGEGSFAFTVHRDHAPFIAEGLYQYLVNRKMEFMAKEEESRLQTSMV